MKPKPMPPVIEKVKGMAVAVITAGAYSVTSSQSTSVRAWTIIQPTNNRAGAVAYTGMVSAKGERNRARRNSPPTVTAVSPVRPPALMPVALSI